MKIQSYRLKKKRCKKDKNKSELFLFSTMMTPSSTFSQAKQKKVKHKDKDKSGCERKKTKSIFVFSNDYSKFHIFWTIAHLCAPPLVHNRDAQSSWSLYITLLYSFSTVPYFIIFFITFFTLRPLFFYTFTLFYSAPYFFLMCALLFYIFALRPTLFTLPPTSCTFFHAFLCVFFYTVPSIYQSYPQSQVAISLNH